jgi:hypothetical protein
MPTIRPARVTQWIARWTSNPEVVGSSPISGYRGSLHPTKKAAQLFPLNIFFHYNPVLMLPLPDLAGNAVLVWYSKLKAYPMIEGINLLPRYS